MRTHLQGRGRPNVDSDMLPILRTGVCRCVQYCISALTPQIAIVRGAPRARRATPFQDVLRHQ